MGSSYRATYRASVDDPEQFWLGEAGAIEWSKPPAQALDGSRAPIYRWFPDGQLNTCANALDRHVAAGRGAHTALVYDSAMLGVQRRYTYDELLSEVAAFAGALRNLGVGQGDRVIIYMPMIPEAPIAMLAAARLGAVHSVVFGGFAPRELAARIDDAKPAAVVTATGGIEPSRRVEYLPAVEEAIRMASHQVPHVVVKAREGFAHEVGTFGDDTTRWLDWDDLQSSAEPAAAVPVAATDPLYILYTSGTTGAPKGVVRDNGSHAVALAWSMKNIYDIGPGDVMWTASDVGWVVGHSYIVYGPLLAGATTVLYEGKPVGTPDAGAFWRVVQDHGVNVLFTAPTALRAIRKADPQARLLADYDRSSLRTLFAAGERLDPETYEWIAAALKVPVIDHWWQTETGWAIAANPLGLEQLPVKAGSPTVPVPGYQIAIVDGMGNPVPAGTEGNIVIKLPLPPGTLATLWGNDQRFVDSYLRTFDGYYATGDSGYLDEDGYLFVMGRTDDVINVSGHRLSTGAMEQVVAQHPAVAECAVVGVADELKGQRPSGYVVLKAGAGVDPAQLQSELVSLVRKQIGPVADFKEVRVVAALPKTRSGKILRKTMRQIADGGDYTVPSTIEDPSVIDDLVRTIRS
ncbi:propionyl-CoA synthetase [Arthrobacter mangrovi]|uniref:Propionyl-CoA synthetase n=1 Tax=Arthrobacter mangrovi TaxID=2966350 RepID=A0ABQ5MXR0_9MICC|nr:propionyl-CoA synthetase [Arthrobacter mangrovi]GLB68698.1 propionyl-CoA synthetase [Arthrobacter mangrovi]